MILRFNRAFALTDEEQFVRLMLQEIPPRPERAGETRAAISACLRQ